MRHRTLLIPLLLLAGFFSLIIAGGKTITPLENYRVYHFLYEEGNSRSVRTSYLKDVADVYIPWKFFISHYQPARCGRPVDGGFGKRMVGGVMLPQGVCYPIDGVRSNIWWDVFWPLEKVLPFFAAYDLSYLLLLAAVLIASYLFFCLPLGPGPVSVLFSVFFTFSFPVARELQFDGLCQCWPFLFFSLFCIRRFFQEENRLGWAALSAAGLFLAIVRSTLQGFGLWLLLWGAFTFWHLLEERRLKDKRVLAGIGTSFLLVLFLGLVWNLESVTIFLKESGRFLVDQELSIPVQIFRRTLAFVFSWGNFFSGDLLDGFNTIDFSKSIRPLGGRESFSYDGNAFFIQPIVIILLITGLVTEIREGWRKSPAARFFLFAIVFDYLVAVSPLYKILYFRFHQWWMLLSVLWFLALVWPKLKAVPARVLAAYSATVFLAFQVAAILLDYSRERLLGIVGRQGILGFEPGVWEQRIDHWILRARGLEIYAVLFWVSLFLLWYLYQKRKLNWLVLGASLSGLALNTFHLNYPQSREPFYAMREKLMAAGPDDPYPADFPGPVFMPNIWLLVNKAPPRIYESLSMESE